MVIVTTPEPTSVADAHAVIGRFRRLAGPSRLRAVFDWTVEMFFQRDVSELVVGGRRNV